MTTNQIEAVLAWGKAKQIIGPDGKGTILGQLKKHQEEFTEIRDAAVLLRHLPTLNNPRHRALLELKDGIGDTIVTLILLCDMMETPINQCDSKPEVERKESILAQHKECQKELVDLIYDAGDTNVSWPICSISRILSHLRIICDMAGVTTEECLAMAYDVISKRTGAMKDGVFVKDSTH